MLSGGYGGGNYGGQGGYGSQGWNQGGGYGDYGYGGQGERKLGLFLVVVFFLIPILRNVIAKCNIEKAESVCLKCYFCQNC